MALPAGPRPPPRSRSSGSASRLSGWLSAVLLAIGFLAAGTPVSAQTPVLTSTNVTVGEAGGAAVFTFTLSEPAGAIVSFEFTTVDLTATSPSDYLQTAGSFEIPPGVTSVTVTVPIVNDTVPEPTERFLLHIFNVVGATPAAREWTGTIVDDDSPPPTTTTTTSPRPTTPPPTTPPPTTPPPSTPPPSTPPPTTPPPTTPPPTNRPPAAPPPAAPPPAAPPPAAPSPAGPQPVATPSPPPAGPAAAGPSAPSSRGAAVALGTRPARLRGFDSSTSAVGDLPLATAAPPAPAVESPVPAPAPAPAPGARPTPGRRPGGPPPGAREKRAERPAFTESVPDPTEVDLSLRAIAQSLFLAGGLVLLIVFPSELFNSTLLENYEEITGWFGARRLHHVRRRLAGFPRSVVTTSFAAVAALVYSQLSPDFGFDRPSLVLFLGLFATLMAASSVYDHARSLYVHRRFGIPSEVRAQIAGLIIAAVMVLISRLSHFLPGYLYGAFTAVAFHREVSDREDGHALAVASALLLAVGFLGWFAWIPVKDAVAGGGSNLVVEVLDTALASLWVATLGAIVFGLAPLRFFYGETVKKWSFWGWVAIYGVGMALFVHTLLDAGFYGSSDTASPTAVLLLFVGFGTFSVLFWGYFRYRHLWQRERV